MSELSDEDVKRIAVAVCDEMERRQNEEVSIYLTPEERTVVQRDHTAARRQALDYIARLKKR